MSITDSLKRRSPQHLEGNLLFLHSNYFKVKRVWKECCLMVNGDLLCLYSNEDDKNKGKIMQEISLLKSHVFETVITSSRKQHVFVIENDEFKMFFSCKNKVELDFWVKGCEGIKYYWERKREAHERKHFLSNQVKKTCVLNIDEDSCEGVTIPFHLSNGSVVNVKMNKDTLYEEFSKYSNEKLLCNINSKICYVDNDGTVKLANESSKICQEFIKSYFIVEPGYKVVVMYFENDSFEEYVLNKKMSTKEVLDCSLVKDAVRLHGINNAGLFFRRASSDNFLLCANDDKPILFLYCEPESYSPNGFLYILNKEKVFGQNLESNTCIKPSTINTGHVSSPSFTTNPNTSGYFPGHNFLSKKNSSEFLMEITPAQIQSQRRYNLKHDNFFVNELSILKSRKVSIPHETGGTFCSNEVASINESKRVCIVEDFKDGSQEDLFLNENDATNNFTSLRISSTTCETNQKTVNENSSKTSNSEEHYSNVESANSSTIVCSSSIDCEVNTQHLEINAINDTLVSEIDVKKKENITSSESAQTFAQASIEICSLTPSLKNSAGCHNNNNIANEIKEETPPFMEKKFNLQTFSQCKRCKSYSVHPLCVMNPQKMKVILRENSQSDYPRHSYLCLSGTHLYYTKGHWLPCDGSSISLSSENIDRKKLNFELGNGIICKWVQETRTSFQWKVVKVPENDINSKSKDLYKHDKNFLNECNPCNVSKNIADESTTTDESTLTNTGTNYSLEKSLEEAFHCRQMDIKQKKYNFLEYPINSILMSNKHRYSQHRSPRHFIKSIIKEVLSICEVFDPFLASERRIIGDDSLTPRIGWMIRNELCTALKSFLTAGFSVKGHFLKIMFSQNNPLLWRYICEISKANDKFNSIIKKIEANPNFKDNDACFRAFVCQLLVQECNQTKNKLLNVWLEKIPLMEAVIEKYFDSSSFWRDVDCDEFKVSFKTLIETTKKLNDYPFQLSLDFETKNSRSVRSASFPNNYYEKNQRSYLISIE
ncbi:uncharacterized protein LOC101240982 isoform X1 [Hydra vulgaris]|uniref:uncharacterized protein LOC101240982 isoform X1 n=1 Tax=Hydra vulgaris TaxID=6087 RepID=UPI001F5ED9AE|nr:uncharacterized protein LOC101240982 isoform X1 [Hydra vulgaris]